MRESFSPQEIRYLKLLRKQYRTIQEASAEVAHLRAVLRLPKGTEHFLSASTCVTRSGITTG